MPLPPSARHAVATARPRTAANPGHQPVATEPTELASRLRLSATRLARRLRQQTDTGLTPSQLSALVTVERNGALTLGALAELERVAPPTVTRIVTRLEADGLLHRQVDDHDRRIVRVAVSDAGASLLEETRRRRDAWLASRIGGLEPDERTRLADALDVLDRLTSEDRP